MTMTTSVITVMGGTMVTVMTMMTVGGEGPDGGTRGGGARHYLGR